MTSVVRRGLTTAAALAAGAGLASVGLTGAATASAAATPPAAVRTLAAATAGPKAAAATDPTITVRVGGVRTEETGPPGPPVATGLAGVTYRATSAGFTPVTCVSNAAGLCTLNVTSDKTYTITQTGVPAGWFANPALATGSGAAATSRPYDSLSVAVGTADVTIPVAAPNSDTSPAARSGTWAESVDDPPLPAGCGLRIALLIDLSGSVSPNFATYKAAARAFVEALQGTPSSVAIYTFGTTAPAPGANNATLGPVSTQTAAGVDTLVDKINGLTVPAASGTNWDAGLWQIVQDNPTFNYQSAFLITDGGPTFYGPAGNGGRGNLTRFEEVENGIFSANALKVEGTSVISVGIGTLKDALASTDNIRAVSGPSAGTDYFNTDFQELSHVLAQLALTNCAGLDVTKAAAPATYDHVGQAVTYTYTVTNPEFFPLHNVHVTDDHIDHNIACAPSTLATEQTATCTAVYSVTQADLDAGHVTNAAHATGITPNDDTVLSGPADATVDARPAPAIHLDKSAAPATYGAPGETIDYTYTVTNTGNVTLHGIDLTDSRLGPVTCPYPALAPGDSMSCSAAHSTTQADVDAGQLTNTADVTGHPPTGPPVTGTDAAAVTAIHQPGVALTKWASPTHYARPGTKIFYFYLVTNTGNVTLHDIGLTDDHLGMITCPQPELAPGSSMICTADHVTTQGDVDRGHIVNTAEVTGRSPSGAGVTASDDASVHAIHRPAIELSKTASPGEFGAAGQSINYSYTVTNTGNTTVGGIVLHDSRLGTITCPSTTLAPAASTTCTAQYITTQADVDKGDIENAATVTGHPPAGPPVTAGDTEAIPAEHLPYIDLVKTAFPATYGAAGEKITYTYTVTNAGNKTLRNVALIDDKLGHVTCLTTTLAPGQSTTCRALHFATQADVDAGQITNAATATGDPPAGPPVTAGDTETVTADHAQGISEQKTAFPTEYGEPGERVTYTYTVVNTGNVTLRNVALHDDRLGPIGCPVTDLAPGESMTCQAVKVTTKADVAAGQFTNVATVTGDPPAGPPVTAAATETVHAVRHPGIQVQKTAFPATYSAPGTAITYVYTVVNTGDVTLRGVNAADDRVGRVRCAASTLAPGHATTCSGGYVTTVRDVAAGSIVNVVTASGRSPGGQLVNGKAEAIVLATALPIIPVTG